jgi:hypothetical protein
MDAAIEEWKDSRCIRIVGGKPPNYRWKCVHCRRTFTGGSRKFFNHILGIRKDKSAEISPCLCALIDPVVVAFCTSKVEDAARGKRQRDEEAADFRRARTLREEEERRAREGADFVEAELEDDLDDGSAGKPKRQCSLSEALEKQCKLSVDKAVAGMMYETGLPSRWAAAPSVREMFNEVCAYAVRSGKSFYRPLEGIDSVRICCWPRSKRWRLTWTLSGCLKSNSGAPW